MSIRKKTIKALADTFLAGALDSFAKGYETDRADALKDKDFNALVERVREIKRDALSGQDNLWAEFKHNAERAGAVIHFAKNATDANNIIKEILKASGAHKIVKSKSMLTEEILLNKSLAESGFEVVETDLGEWILQLDNDRPSHIVMPAIHKTAESVAVTLGKEAGVPLSADVPALIKRARARLREEFYSADAGITGANIAVASIGSLILVTNEGNGRMVTTEPGLHIAVVGLEKIVPSVADALTILELLPPCATGQRISSYVSFITGPLREAQHIVIVDNGRSEIAADADFAEALYCIRCGACLNVCPVYLAVGGHVFGHIYMGGIGTTLTAFHHGLEAATAHSLCLGCRACVEQCPAEIDTPKLIEQLRKKIVLSKGLPWSKAYLLRKILRDRRKFHSMLKTLSKLQIPFTKHGYVRHLPLRLAGYHTGRAIPALARKPLREIIEQVIPAKGEKRMRVGYFSGCLIDFVYPDMGQKVIDILAHFGCEVVTPVEQTCCGIPAMHEGEFDVAREVARDNLKAFAAADVDAIVTGCATCTSSLKRYGELLNDDMAEEFTSKVFGICDFLTDVLDIEVDSSRVTGEVIDITYHDSCHLKRRLGTHNQPRRLLGAYGYRILEMDEADRCCGFAGAFAIDFPELSTRLGRRKIDGITETGSEVVAMDCPGCILQLKGTGPDIQVAHTIELLWDAIFKGK